jgi:hypothetical protein
MSDQLAIQARKVTLAQQAIPDLPGRTCTVGLPETSQAHQQP